MEKHCVICDKIFETKTIYRKYCSRHCKNVAAGNIATETSRKCAYCGNTFYSKGKRIYCSKLCKSRKGHETESGKPLMLMRGRMLQDDAGLIERVRAKTSRFEYISGWTGSDGYVYLECKDCGLIFCHSAIFLKPSRNANIKCPTCNKAKDYVPTNAIKHVCSNCGNIYYCKGKSLYCSDRCRKEYSRILNRKYKRKPKPKKVLIKVCEWCNQEYYPANGNSKYCSDKCARKSSVRRQELKKRIKGNPREIGKINLKVLFERDNGICALCGTLCDWTDYEIKDGAFYTGSKYPSRDHIIPLAKGGKDDWSNIQLAHFKCNWLKGDTYNDKVFSSARAEKAKRNNKRHTARQKETC